MADLENFNQLVDKVMSEKGYAHMRPVIEKELLHYDILFALEKEGILDQITFQGGTCLRLCYGSQRYSEDLDFVGGNDFSSKQVQEIKLIVETYLGKRYGLEVNVKEPKELAELPEYKDIKVDRWQVSINTSPQRKDIPKQRIKLEIANVAVYTRVPQSIEQNYEVLPDGYDDMLVLSESLDEIMADKIVSLVSCQKRIRHRDIWDLKWLKQKKAVINPEFILAKIKDYRIYNYQDMLEQMILNLKTIVHGKPFLDEMTRFLPSNVQERTLSKPKYLQSLALENEAILKETQSILNS